MRIVPHVSKGQDNIFCFIKRGFYYTQDPINPMSAGNITVTANRIYAAPFYVGKNIAADRMGIYVGTGINLAKARVGIYENHETLIIPKTLLRSSAEFDCTLGGANIKEDTGFTIQPLKGGKIYWLAFIANDAITVTGGACAQWILGWHYLETSDDPQPVNYVYGAQTYGAFPTTFPTIDQLGSYRTDSQYGPLVYFRTV